jgi:IS605 OrfB family transposase
MVQTTKCYLIYQEQENMDYRRFCEIMWDIQKQVRQFKNWASSACFSYLTERAKRKEENGVYPTDEDLVGCNMRTYLYQECVKMIPTLYTSGVSSVRDNVYHYFMTRKLDILRGDISIPSYGKDQPIDLHNKQIKFYEKGGKICVDLSMFSRNGKSTYGLNSLQVSFEVFHKCQSSIAIIERCMSGEYEVRGSKIQYDKRKRMWELCLSYKFEKKQNDLDPNKILGIDLGVRHPFVATISGEQKRWFVHGGEVEAFREKTEAMRVSLRKARVYAGDGSVGHGMETRTKAAGRVGSRIARFRDTKNHAWSREIVNIAVKNGCGTIQMEDLTGISAGKKPMFLKDWTYYDLQQKIRYKAEAEGIKVVLVAPQYTSQRCSCCGYIDEDNLDDSFTQFKCLECGYEADSDLNAAINISIRDIDRIIKEKHEGKASKKTA